MMPRKKRKHSVDSQPTQPPARKKQRKNSAKIEDVRMEDATEFAKQSQNGDQNRLPRIRKARKTAEARIKSFSATHESQDEFSDSEFEMGRNKRIKREHSEILPQNVCSVPFCS